VVQGGMKPATRSAEEEEEEEVMVADYPSTVYTYLAIKTLSNFF
jgi:hypothetical protein